ncbi:MAG: D-alanine--D-alanine ligase [Gemmatimonadota bacterium]|nr:D-alanine--D-alanine ligase [Gemmatimonadota bacterium]
MSASSSVPLRITVLMGGASAERNVSLASGLRIVEALAGRGHVVTALDPATGVLSPTELAELRTRNVGTEPPSLEALAGLVERYLMDDLIAMPELREADVVFLALHGGQGEDGTIQALLDMAGVRYTGSGHLASALAMDKDLSKTLFRAAGVQTAEWLMAPQPAGLVEQSLGLPVVVKPSKQGSTVGLSIVRNAMDLDAAVAEAFRYDDEVMIERFIAGRELTVGVLGDDALPVGEIKPAKEIYDYECKYTPGMAVEEFPANLSPNVTKKLQEQSLRAFRALKLRGYARVDFRLDERGECFCLEANTLPGMTELSLIPQGAAAAGIAFDELCERIVQLALG